MTKEDKPQPSNINQTMQLTLLADQAYSLLKKHAFLQRDVYDAPLG